MMEREGHRRPQLDRVWPWHDAIDRHAIRPAVLAAIVAVALLLRFGLIFGGRLWECRCPSGSWSAGLPGVPWSGGGHRCG